MCGPPPARVAYGDLLTIQPRNIIYLIPEAAKSKMITALMIHLRRCESNCSLQRQLTSANQEFTGSLVKYFNFGDSIGGESDKSGKWKVCCPTFASHVDSVLFTYRTFSESCTLSLESLNSENVKLVL